MERDELVAGIDTIVVVMMENRSFDHLLGHLRLPAYGGRAEVEGLASLDDPALANPAGSGAQIAPFLAGDGELTQDLPHERELVAVQLGPELDMKGFVRAFEQATGAGAGPRPPPMGILTPDALPVTSFLAREFTVCDNWFAPLPTSTQPNRLVSLSGFTRVDRTHSGLLPDQDLVFDWLDRHRVSWRVYSAGLSFFMLVPKMWPVLLTDRFRSLSELARDVMRDDASTWPSVVFIEPDYDDSPVHISGHACDNHAPLAVAFGEHFLQQVYDALSSNGERWRRTLLVVTYDEHGGFFDHVAPPKIACPTPPGATYAPFVTTGVRVPAIVASRFGAPGGVCHETFDHTSILQTIAERFGAPGEAYSPEVDARRAAGIRPLSCALDGGADRAVAPESPNVAIPVVGASLATTRVPATNAARNFAAAVEAFAAKHGNQALDAYPEIAHWLAVR